MKREEKRGKDISPLMGGGKKERKKEEGKEKRIGRKGEMAILECLKEILQVLMHSHRVTA